MDNHVKTKAVEIRKDFLTDSTVFLVEGRDERPTDLGKKLLGVEPSSGPCPFCPDHEAETPDECWRFPADSGRDWRVRVMPNLHAIALIEGKDLPDTKHRGEKRISDVFGAHEVVVLTPNHNATLATMGKNQIQLWLEVLVARLKDLYDKVSRIKFAETFINFGLPAGASLYHPHLQIVYKGSIPNRHKRLSRQLLLYREKNGESQFATTIREAEEDGRICVNPNAYTDFVAICPFASYQPYMIRVIPRQPLINLSEAQVHLPELAAILDEAFKRLTGIWGFLPALNVAFRQAPNGWDRQKGHFHFWIDIVPKVNEPGGLGTSTDFREFVNGLPPEVAAARLREVTP